MTGPASSTLTAAQMQAHLARVCGRPVEYSQVAPPPIPDLQASDELWGDGLAGVGSGNGGSVRCRFQGCISSETGVEILLCARLRGRGGLRRMDARAHSRASQGLWAFLKAGGFDMSTSVVLDVTGREPQDFADFLATLDL